jgi:hypothetical protein
MSSNEDFFGVALRRGAVVRGGDFLDLMNTI